MTGPGSEIRYDEARATLRRLLGPAGPEVSCEECFEALDRYVDAEVSGVEPELAVPGMAAHLEGCPACAEDHESLLALVAGQPSREESK